MRIVFLVVGNSRRSNYINGYNLRYGNGSGSGTDGSAILVAEYLAKQGHEVVFVADELEPLLIAEHNKNDNFNILGKEVYGVKYTNINFDGIDNLEFDILVNMLWFQDYDKLKIKVTKSLIYWSHMQWIYGIDEMLRYVKNNNLSLGFINISNWEKLMNDNVMNRAIREANAIATIIPNPIMNEMIDEVLATNSIRKKHKFVFHAAWARGGDIALDAVRKLDFADKEFHAFDYLMCTHPHQDDFFYKHNGVDKRTLFQHISESEYFIYPLYTPYQDVHKDTFSCVVAEAIALGAIVITYPLGALPENFNDYCIWLNFPNDTNPKQMQLEPLSKDLEGKFKCTDNIVDKILFLENNSKIKEDIRNKGKEYIIDNFNIDKIGQLWVDFINKL